VCLETPAILYAIGYYFRDFSQMSDEEVVATLQATRAATRASLPRWRRTSRPAAGSSAEPATFASTALAAVPYSQLETVAALTTK